MNEDPKTHGFLEVENLTTRFRTADGWFTAVDGVSFELARGRSLGLVGESGSGKSATCMSIVRLHSARSGPSVTGSVRFNGTELLSLPEKWMRRVRGSGIALVLQDPLTSLNPTMTIGQQVAEAVRLRRPLRGRELREVCLEGLARVGIPGPRERYSHYPHQLSGGMRQRVAIAIALACEPELLIADEPTTALDATIQDQVLRLLQKLQRELGFGMIFVSHDLGVVSGMCDDVSVMYQGRIVESGPAASVLRAPEHPYTKALTAASTLDRRAASKTTAWPDPSVGGEAPA